MQYLLGIKFEKNKIKKKIKDISFRVANND